MELTTHFGNKKLHDVTTLPSSSKPERTEKPTPACQNATQRTHLRTKSTYSADARKYTGWQTELNSFR